MRIEERGYSMITDEQGRDWLLRKMYDDGWRYYVRNIGGVAYLTTKKPVMTGNILEITSGGTTKCVSAIRSIMPKIDKCGVLDIAEELGIVDWSNIKVDTPVLVSSNGITWKKRYFAKADYCDIYVWNNGATSWSAKDNNDTTVWAHIKLAEV